MWYVVTKKTGSGDSSKTIEEPPKCLMCLWPNKYSTVKKKRVKQKQAMYRKCMYSCTHVRSFSVCLMVAVIFNFACSICKQFVIVHASLRHCPFCVEQTVMWFT